MNAAVAQELWQGQTIDGKFALLESLGGSAHSAVFRTQLPGSSNQPAAIKLIRADREDAAQQIARWRGLVALSHPNLLQLFQAGHCQMSGAPWLYVVMEYAEVTLAKLLTQRALAPDALRKGMRRPGTRQPPKSQRKIALFSCQSPPDHNPTAYHSRLCTESGQGGVTIP